MNAIAVNRTIKHQLATFTYHYIGISVLVTAYACHYCQQHNALTSTFCIIQLTYHYSLLHMNAITVNVTVRLSPPLRIYHIIKKNQFSLLHINAITVNSTITHQQSPFTYKTFSLSILSTHLEWHYCQHHNHPPTSTVQSSLNKTINELYYIWMTLR